jgi:DNA adenine methylase
MARKPERLKPERLLFGYAGSKWTLSPKYVSLFPKHSVYVSPFGGTASEFAFKERSHREVFNDLDDNVYSVFAVLRDRTLRPELMRMLETSPDSRRLYRECYTRLRTEDLSLLERAYCFLVAGNIGYLGRHPALAGGYAAGLKKQSHRLIRLPEILLQWHDRMRWVEIEHWDAFDLIDKYDAPKTFFFLDPPYHPATCDSDLYLHEKFDHRRLLSRLQRLKGKAMVCGYAHGLYEVQLLNWRRVEFVVAKSLGGRRNRTEVVWMNYDEQGEKLPQCLDLIEAFCRLPA